MRPDPDPPSATPMLAARPAVKERLPWSQLAARGAYLFAVSACLVMLVAIAPHGYRLVASEWQTMNSYPALIGTVSYPAYVRYLLVIRYLGLSVFLATAALIIRRRWHDRMALLTSATLVLMPTMLLYLGEVQNLEFESPWGRVVEAAQGMITTLAIAGMILFSLLFPDGKFTPRWMLALVIPLLAFLSLMYNLSSQDFYGEWPWYLLLFAVLLLLAVSIPVQIYRYRRLDNPASRQQIKWVVFAITLLTVGFLFVMITGYLGDVYPSRRAFLALISIHLNVIYPTFIPVSIGISILRYRLWDIDVIIRRTLVYGSLSVTLAVIYFSSVVLLQSSIAAVGGQQSAVITVISTLLIAALFTPLRRRIQSDIDRRFYRRKYDSEKTVASFSARLRQEVDLEQIGEQLLSVIQETLQPREVSIWLKPAPRKPAAEPLTAPGEKG